MKKYLNFIELYPIVSIASFITIVPILILLLRYKPIYLRIFFLYLIGQLIADIIGVHLASQTKNTILLCNLWHLFSFIILAYMFRVIINNRIFKTVIYCLLFIYTVVFFCDLLHTNKDLLDFNNYRYLLIIPTLECFLLMSLCLYYYLNMLDNLEDDNILHSTIFWIISSLFIYNATSIFATTFYYWYMVWNDDRGLMMIIYVPYVVYIFSIIMLSIGLFLSKNKLVDLN